MKNMKKLASLLLVLVMVLALAAPAMAAGPDPETGGKIVVKNAVPGQTYTLYKLFDLSYGGNAEDVENANAPHTYTVNENWKEFINQNTINGVYVDVDAQGYVTWHQNKETVDGEVKMVNADPAEFAKLALAYAKANSIANQGSQEAPAAAEGETISTVTFGNLPLGYYLIDSSLGALCALDTTNATANVTEKNEKPKEDKEVTNPEGLKVGDTVEYKITVTVAAGAENYVVHDTMSKGLTFNTSSLAVKIGENAVDTENYTYTYAQEGAPLEDKCTFEVKFENDYMKTLEVGTVITLTYKATINPDAVKVDTVTNKTHLDYGDGNTVNTTPEQNVPTPLYSFDMVKISSKKALLSGAEFQLLDKRGTAISLVDMGNNQYRPAVEGDTSSTDTIITNDKAITFVGFSSGTYQLKETKAPTGYNLLKDPVQIEITENEEKTQATLTVGESTQTIGVDVNDNTKNHFAATVTPTNETGEDADQNTIVDGVQIVNLTGAELPSTGGIGTTLFYIVGGLLIVGAAVLLITKKRVSGEQ